MWMLTLAAVCLLTYWPALDNGFIADDYVFLERASQLSTDPGLLLRIPPEFFRSMTYLEFFVLKSLFGYFPPAFYLFSIALHFANSLLVGRLLWRLTGRRFDGCVGALIFACFQNPQEAVMWLAGSHELPALFFMLASLNLWLSGRWPWSLLLFGAAMFSKESALILVLLLPLADIWAGRPVRLLPYLCFAAAATGGALLFWRQWSDNSLVGAGLYAFGFHAVEVWGRSLFRLLVPWAPIFIGVAWWRERRLPLGKWAPAAVWITFGLLPYIFLTYQNHVPSRHEYLASVGVAALLAAALSTMKSRRWAAGILLIFMLGNMLYILLRKDRQFEIRAAPTEQLIQFLETHAPEPVSIRNLPFNGWIAKLTTRTVPGWNPRLIFVADVDASCGECPVLRWDSERLVYHISPVPH